jgi:hypothetical protein
MMPAFIETGTFKGDGVRTARGMDTFYPIITIEKNLEMYSRHAFGLMMEDIHPLFGDSRLFLKGVLDIAQYGVIWLDAHSPDDNPLLVELMEIGLSSGTYVVLIDDAPRMGTNKAGDAWLDVTHDRVNRVMDAFGIKFIRSLDTDAGPNEVWVCLKEG